MSPPQLVPVRVPRHPDGAVLVLHGGAGRADSPTVRPTQLSVLRMVPIAQRVALAGRGRLAVYRLLNSSRGWNQERTPVDDARWALDRIADDLGPVPACLIGHSLGGRAALLAADAANVTSAVALNPYLYASDGASVRDRRILIVHGTADRIAPLQTAEVVARRMARANDVELVRVPGGKHAMLSHHGAFDHRAARFAVDTLLGDRRAG